MDDYGVVFIVVIERRLIKRPRTFYLYENVGSFPFFNHEHIQVVSEI
jgi:hypothetical protein